MVAGLSCSGCVNTLTRKALGIYGVLHVDVDLHSGGDSPVRLTHAEAMDLDAIASALSELGYRVALPAHG
jgi:copper chaperone